MEQFSRRSYLQLLMAILLVLALGVPLQMAEAAPVTVISNIADLNQQSAGVNTLMAAGFTTPASPAYFATSADVKIMNPFPGSSTLNAWLYSDNAGMPGSAVATFTPISIPPTGSSFNHQYSLILGTPYLLAPNTTYWLVLQMGLLFWDFGPTVPSGIFTFSGNRMFTGGVWQASSYGTKWALNAEPEPAVLVDPTSLDFGDVPVFDWSASQTVTLTNTGSGDLHIGAISNDGDFWVLPWMDDCSNQTVLPAGTCTFDVIFTPSSTGAKTGTVSIPSDAASTPDTVALTGNGVASEIQVTPSPLAFGSQLVGTSSAQTVTITNIGGADLHTGVLTITGAAYSLVDNLCDNATLIPNATCTFGVTFTPPAAGAMAGEVSIPSDSGGLVEQDMAKGTAYYPVTTPLPLTGTGILAQTTLVMRSNGGYDGTMREIRKDAKVGGFNEPISALISVGDDYLNRQYVGILDFNTSSIPDNAVITSVRVRVKGMILSNTTYTRLGEMTADIMNPHFGTTAGLENMDFQAPALFKNVGTFTHAPTYYKWITMNVNPAAFSAVNLTGTTQFRLHFQKKYYDDHIKQMLRFLSGDFWIPSDFPMLVVTYYVP